MKTSYKYEKVDDTTMKIITTTISEQIVDTAFLQQQLDELKNQKEVIITNTDSSITDQENLINKALSIGCKLI